MIGDLEYPIDDGFVDASGTSRGIDAVIFAAGSGGKTGKDKTVLIDQLGAIRSMVAAFNAGAMRYIMLSSLNADINSESKIKHYHRAKAHADHFLRTMHQVMDGSLDWTTVHPGRLTDETGTGNVAVSDQLLGSGQTSRDNTAAVLVACLDLSNTIGKSFSVLDGDMPMHEALNNV